MGQPAYLSEKDVELLQEGSRLVNETQSFSYKHGAVFLQTNLPPHAVTAITISFAPQQP
jgi:hypothetical protein